MACGCGLRPGNNFTTFSAISNSAKYQELQIDAGPNTASLLAIARSLGFDGMCDPANDGT
jgi:hypothetical protein